ncbi:MAG: HD domain-containing protein [Planctomycetota bacterium]|nr:HD domain-containing protein [Planctomycetota bacterium]
MDRLPEFSAHDTSLIRIPDQLDVPVSPRVRRILDSATMQRLRGISQLGLVAKVYPGATHSRFEHSLGVYRLACQVLQKLLAVESDFSANLTPEDAECFLLVALLHDVGHWPYCHPIEDLQLDWVPRHEELARRLICGGELSKHIESDWRVAPETVADFLAGKQPGSAAAAVLQNVMNGPVDIDKMDYLQRDSLHAGVPYGCNFDVGRLIASLCIGQDQRGLAISEKGKTAAEMMVFARYVMFSEVYWHHAVRSATAMLQRLVFELREQMNPASWLQQSDAEFGANYLSQSQAKPDIQCLADSLFGNRRALYKRVGQFSYMENPELHSALSRLPYSELVEISERFAGRLRSDGVDCGPSEVLIDAPPVKLEVQFRLSVRIEGTENTPKFVPLSTISPVVKSLATEQFDSFVKRVRVLVAPKVAAGLKMNQSEIVERLLESVG